MSELHSESINVLKSIGEKATNLDKIVFVSGNFNILHPGHLRLIRFAADCGDLLVIGVNADGWPGTILSENIRVGNVQSISYVDFAFVLRDPPERFIEQLKPHIIVKGKEHEDQFNPELEILKSYGGHLLFSSGDINISSIDILRDEFKNLKYSTIIKPEEYLEHHNFSMNDLIPFIRKMEEIRVVVIGDTIVDEYITCEPIGMSQEDPAIVVKPIINEKFVGGAGIVSAHAKGLGAKVDFFSVIGEDENAKFVKSKLDEYGVNSKLFVDESRPTIFKQKYCSNGKTFLKVNHYHQHGISQEIQKIILSELADIIENIQLVIFSDFNYGCLPQSMVNKIISICNDKKIIMVADSQSSSQFGDVSRFRTTMLLTPTEREARLSMRDFDSGLVILADKLKRRTKTGNILLTLGKEGVLIHTTISSHSKWLTDRLPAMNTAPKDLKGAGDSLLACTSMALAGGADIWQSAYLGSLAAACQVDKIGNIPLTQKEILFEIQR